MKVFYDIINLNQVHSTQTYLIDKNEQNELLEYTVVSTTNQTAGKGQGTHIWESRKDKNISFSLLLKPIFLNPSDQFIITQFISLAIVDVLKDCGLQGVKIKWPNDIYVKENKICGMLIQNTIIGSSISQTYIGIGLNVNQKKFEFAPNPTSLVLETGKEYDLTQILHKVLDAIYVRYEQLKNNKISEIKKEYLSLLLFKNQFRTYIYNSVRINAKILGVNSFGHLILQREDNQMIECELRTLQFVF